MPISGIVIVLLVYGINLKGMKAVIHSGRYA